MHPTVYRVMAIATLGWKLIKPIKTHLAAYWPYCVAGQFIALIDGHRPLARYVKLRVAHAPGTFSPPPRISDPNMHQGTCAMHVPRCMPGSLTSGFLWSRWRRKRSRHSRRMRNPQFTYLVRGPCTDKSAYIRNLTETRTVNIKW